MSYLRHLSKPWMAISRMGSEIMGYPEARGLLLDLYLNFLQNTFMYHLFYLKSIFKDKIEMSCSQMSSWFGDRAGLHS